MHTTEYINYFHNDLNNLANYIYQSNKIEGSSLSLAKTLQVLKSKEASNVEELEVLGLYNATSLVYSFYKERFQPNDLTELHRFLMQDIRPSIAGNLRTEDVHTFVRQPDTTIRKHQYLEQELVEETLKELFNKPLNSLKDVALFKLELARIHPFIDGNGRTSRLALNWVLMYLGYPPVTIKGDTPETRNRYINSMAEYSKDGNYQPFLTLLEEEVLTTMKQINPTNTSNMDKESAEISDERLIKRIMLRSEFKDVLGISISKYGSYILLLDRDDPVLYVDFIEEVTAALGVTYDDNFMGTYVTSKFKDSFRRNKGKEGWLYVER